MHRLPLCLTLLLAVGLAACDATAEFVIGGTYTGQSNFQAGLEADLTLVIPETETGGTFAFTGTLDQTGLPPESISGTGTYDHPALELTVEDEAVTATVSADGSVLAFDDDPDEEAIMLRRQ